MKKVNSICVVGIDGTGKSTVVKLMYEMFGKDNSIVQYMGYKNWETKIAKRCLDSSNKASKLARHISIIIEFYYRIYKHRNTRKIIIFDRYVDERILALKSDETWKKKIIKEIYIFFLKKIFYQPTITFYLTCDLEISVHRKDDINTQAEIKCLTESKERLDKYYINKENVMVIDTSHNSIEDTLQIIKERLREEPCFNIMIENP